VEGPEGGAVAGGAKVRNEKINFTLEYSKRARV
jgi:hypothetical protein